MSRRRRQAERRMGLREPAGVNATQKQVEALRKVLPQATLVASYDQGYDAARQLSNHAFSPWPLVVVYCEVPADVATCLAWAHEHDIWTVVRSGGHSTAGYSANTGLVIDMSRFRYAVVEDPTSDDPTAVVGAGTNFGHLNAVLNDYGLHVPGGGCPDVCVAGYMQGGGFGFTSRAFGMNCDNVVSVRVMLADGSIVIADESTNADLFWAIRGGTGNNFGVLLEVRYRLHRLEAGDIWGFGLTWPAEHAAEALHVIQEQFTRGAPPEIGYMAFLAVDVPPGVTEGNPVLMMRGMYLGGERDGRVLLRPLLETSGATLDMSSEGTYEELNHTLLAEPREIPEVPDLGREDKQSGYIDRLLSVDEWQSVVDRFLETPNPWSTIVIEPYGGRITDVEPYGNAFVHRDVDMDVFVDVFWMTDEEHTEVEQYLNGFMALFEPMMNGHSYQNYPRRNTPDYRWRYWKDSFDALLAVKDKYDPAHFFRYAQSISAPAEPEPRLGGGPDLTERLERPIMRLTDPR